MQYFICLCIGSYLTRLLQLRSAMSAININIQQVTEVTAHTQNSLARIVRGSSRANQITPVQAGLHWLPICCHIQLKLVDIKFTVLTAHWLGYLSGLLQYYKLRMRPSFCVPAVEMNGNVFLPTKSKFVDLAFQLVDPTILNNLSTNITSNLSIMFVRFKCTL